MIAFNDTEGQVHHKFLAQGCGATTSVRLSTQRICNASEKQFIGNCLTHGFCYLLLPLDNAVCRVALNVTDFLAKHSISVVSHLALCDLLLLPKLKITLKGRRQKDIPQIKLNTICRCWPFHKVLPHTHWKGSLESLNTIWSILLWRKKLSSNLKMLKFSYNK